MAYRKPQRYFSFADLAVENHADKNRALSVLKRDLCMNSIPTVLQLSEEAAISVSI
jgi:hypothetical protein